MEPDRNHGLKLDLNLSMILEGAMVIGIIGIVGLMIQMRQDIVLLREQMSNVVAAKEFAGFRSSTELQDADQNKRIEKLENTVERIRHK